ncbi:MAG: tetratricopeptide repeat protein [Caldilineaceae bacterium]
MAETLELVLLGNPEIRLAGQSLPRLRSAKTYALLYYLAVTRRAQPRTVLAGLFWGDVDEYYARRNLNRTLSDLTKAVGDHLMIDRQSLAFAYSRPYWLDVEVLEAAAKLLPTTQNLATLTAAANLYRGDFLAGFYVQDAPEFEQWVLSERTRRRADAVQLHHALAAFYAAQGDLARAIDYTRRLLQLEPWREEAHRQLMLLLAQSGQRSAALAQYELCRQVLSTELDVEPAAATVQLVEQIRRGAIQPSAQLPAQLPIQPSTPAAPQPLPVHPPPPPSVTRSALPTPVTPFVGRTQELEAIRRRLLDPDCHLLTLVGTGGSGKTRLALEVARQLSANPSEHGLFADGLVFVPLQPLDATSEIVPAIAKVLGVSLSGSTPLETQLHQQLRELHLLLVLDNFEHLLDGAQLVSELLTAAPGVKILVTTREPLNLQEAWFHPISGMSLPRLATEAQAVGDESPTLPTPPAGPNQAGTDDAGQLFVQSAQRAHSGFAAAREAPEIGRICHLLGGMPLAIELAAAWTRVLSCREIREEIERSLDFLHTSLQNVPERHRSLRAILEQTWRRLTEPEKRVLSKFSVFRGSCTRVAAEAVTGATLPILAALVERVLLWRTVDGRYEMHELIRQFAVEKLAADQPLADAKHADYYAAFCATHTPTPHHPNGATVADRLRTLRGEFDNVLVAWRTSLQNQWLEPLMQMAEPVARLYESEARYRYGTQQLQAAARVLQPHAARPEVARTLAGVNGWLGRFHLPLRLLAQAEHFYLEQRTLAQRVGDKQHYAAALAGLARVAMDQGRPEDGQALAQNAIDLLRLEPKSRALIDAQHALGITYLGRGNSQQAEEHFQQAVAIGRQLGDIEAMLPSYINLGFAAMDVGDYAKSKRLLLDALALAQSVECKTDWARLYFRLGRTCEMTGDYAEALTYFAQARTISRRESNVYLEGTIDRSEGDIQRLLGNYQQARVLLQNALTASQSIELTSSIGMDLSRLALLEEDEGHWELACQYLREAADLGMQGGRKVDVLFCQAHLARVLVRMGRLDEATAVLRTALTWVKPGQFQTATLILILSAAIHRYVTAKDDEAIAWMTFVMQHPAASAATRNLAQTWRTQYEPEPVDLSQGLDTSAPPLEFAGVLASIVRRYGVVDE